MSYVAGPPRSADLRLWGAGAECVTESVGHFVDGMRLAGCDVVRAGCRLISGEREKVGSGDVLYVYEVSKLSAVFEHLGRFRAF